PRAHFLVEAPGGVVDHVVDGLLDRGNAVAVDDLAEADGGELRGADLGAKVADVVGDAVVGLQRVQDVAALLAAIDDLDHRPAHTLTPDVAGGHVVAARHGAAGVAVMT